MIKKRTYISSRIAEMRLYREAAVRAIKKAGMEPLFFDSTDLQKRWPVKRGVPIMTQLLEAIGTADAFVGLYGHSLKDNWAPEGSPKRSMELEYEAVGQMPCFPYFLPPSPLDDDIMISFRKKVMETGVEFLSTPDELYKDLLLQLKTLKSKIFISYSSKDQDFVDALSRKLKNSGHYAWKNTESIAKGDYWHEAMTKGLLETDLLVLVISKEALESKWVKEEWKTFLNANKKIIPLLLKECKLPKLLSSLEMIKAADADWYTKLIRAIGQNT